VAGRGVRGRVDGRDVIVGTGAFLGATGVDVAPLATVSDGGAAVTYLAVDGRLGRRPADDRRDQARGRERRSGAGAGRNRGLAG